MAKRADHVSAWVWVGVAVLGGVGSIARFFVNSLVSWHVGSDFPFGTLTVNLTGSLFVGLLTGLAVGGDLLVLAVAATLGSYTTFSTWMLQTQRLAQAANTHGAVVNVVLSLALGIAAVALGRAIGAQL